MSEPFDSVRHDLAVLRRRVSLELPEPTSFHRSELSAVLRSLDEADRCLSRMERGEPEPRTISVPLLAAGGGW